MAIVRTIAARASAGARQWLLPLVGMMIGCSQATSVPSESQQQQETLSAPVTVTLSAPSPLSPVGPVIEASNTVIIGAGMEVVSGTVVAMGSPTVAVHAEPDALLNDVWSRGGFEPRDRDNVRGILHAKTLVVGPNGPPSGLVIAGRDLTPAFDPASRLSWNVTYPSPTATTNITVALDTSPPAFAPGQYGNVVVFARGTLTLKSGTYYTDTFDVEPQSTVKLDQANGPVIIYVGSSNPNSIILRGSIVPLTGTDPPDLLIAYLGTWNFAVESLYNGALIAPFASMKLNALPGIHTGFFAGKDFNVVDAHVRVQYRAPLALVKAANPSGPKCLELVSLPGLTPAQIAQNAARYCSSGVCSPSHDDTDHDTIEDCVDGCPYDPLKSKPGTCGCGVSDLDRDHDGVSDCIDECPDDPNNTSVGECGCVGTGPALKPAGTACNDPGYQSATPTTCNGAGVCGTRANGRPASDCRYVTSEGVSYWLCGMGTPDGGTVGRMTQSAAQTACSAKGLTLMRIDSSFQNRFIARFLTNPVWLGANDLSTSGTWRWSAPNTNNGDQFWSGGPTGTRVNNLYSNWGRNAPGTVQKCAAMRQDGFWFDADCSETLGYICVFKIRFVQRDSGSVVRPPPFGPCVSPEAGGLPATLPELIRQVEAGVADGAFKNPPPDGSRCPDNPALDGIGIHADAGEGCFLQNLQPLDGGQCFEDNDCSRFGAGYVCRDVKDNANCIPPDGGPGGNAPTVPTTATCIGHKRCGILVCPVDNSNCNQVDLCGANTDFDAGVDPASNLDAETFSPAALFGSKKPDASPSTSYKDDPIRGDAGKNHAWCFMNPQNPDSVPPAVQPPKNKHGSSGSGSPLSFDFDPDLVFDVQANPLALGETDMKLHAAATLVARVHLNNFLGQNFNLDVLDVAAGVLAQRCSINDNETHFHVMGLDFIDPKDLGIPIFDTANRAQFPQLGKLTQDCQAAVEKFVLYANRVKKAFRDAQQLADQFKNLKSVGQLLSGDLCQQIGVVAADVPGFPGGNICPPHEPVEITINRFIEYYQGAGGGQATQLKQVAGALSSVSALFNSALHQDFNLLNFKGIDKHESRTVVSIPFAIGPVPMLLEIDAFARYGIAGKFVASLNFGSVLNLDGAPKDDPDNPDNPPPDPVEVARVTAQVVPHASAGLAAFVGAGTNLGAFSASVGIEGAVTLAEVQAPIYAGVGVDVLVTKDIRLIPDDIARNAMAPRAFQLSIPKAFKFFVNYNYGAGVDLDHVLSGTVNARLRIKFLFFSRTWRKRVVSFNGWSAHYDLVSGGNSTNPNLAPKKLVTSEGLPSTGLLDPETARAATNVAEGQTVAGLSEAQLPLMTLAYLPVPGGTRVNGGPDNTGAMGVTAEFNDPNQDEVLAAPGDTVPFDAGAVQGFFYDDLCCLKPPDTTLCSINGTPHCCPGFDCVAFIDAPPGKGSCFPRCKNPNEKCQTAADCCAVDAGAPLVCGSIQTCVACSAINQPCRQGASDCCSGLTCDPATNICINPTACRAGGQSCTRTGATDNCCSGFGCTTDTNICTMIIP